MRTGTGRLAVALVATIGVLGGCANQIEGSATAADGPAPSSSRPTPSPPALIPPSSPITPSSPSGVSPPTTKPVPPGGAGPEFPRPSGALPPKRPADLPFAGVDPCSLVTDAVRKQLGATGAPKPDKTQCSVPLAKGRLVVNLDNSPAESYLDNTKVVGYPLGVGGYPAVVGWNKPDDGGGCFVNVDTADASNLEVGVLADDGTGTATLCPIALDAAGQALSALRAR